MSIATIVLVLGGPILGLYAADKVIPAVFRWRRRTRRAKRKACR